MSPEKWEAGNGLKMGVVSEAIHLEKATLEVAVRIVSRRSTEQVQNLDCVNEGRISRHLEN